MGVYHMLIFASTLYLITALPAPHKEKQKAFKESFGLPSGLFNKNNKVQEILKGKEKADVSQEKTSNHRPVLPPRSLNKQKNTVEEIFKDKTAQEKTSKGNFNLPNGLLNKKNGLLKKQSDKAEKAASKITPEKMFGMPGGLVAKQDKKVKKSLDGKQKAAQKKVPLAKSPSKVLAKRDENPESVISVDIGYGQCATFGLYPDMAMYGYNTDKLSNTPIEECLRACAKARTFICRSADYNPNSNTCYMSSESKETAPGDYSYNHNTNYYHFLDEMSCDEVDDNQITDTDTDWYDTTYYYTSY